MAEQKDWQTFPPDDRRSSHDNNRPHVDLRPSRNDYCHQDDTDSSGEDLDSSESDWPSEEESKTIINDMFDLDFDRLNKLQNTASESKRAQLRQEIQKRKEEYTGQMKVNEEKWEKTNKRRQVRREKRERRKAAKGKGNIR